MAKRRRKSRKRGSVKHVSKLRNDMYKTYEKLEKILYKFEDLGIDLPMQEEIPNVRDFISLVGEASSDL